MDRLLSIIFGLEYEMKLWEFLPSFATNLIYYSLNILPGIGILKLFDEYKKLSSTTALTNSAMRER
jgi:hypothetical protein